MRQEYVHADPNGAFHKEITIVLDKIRNKELSNKDENDFFIIMKTIIARQDVAVVSGFASLKKSAWHIHALCV